MAIVLMTGIAILVVIFFGGLFSIIAVAGKEWRKAKNSQVKTTFGLWEVCGGYKSTVTAKYLYNIQSI